MFKRNGYKLKSDVRKLLMSTNELFQSSITPEESRSIRFMWNKILGDNATVLVKRFSRQKNHFGFRISTEFTEKGYEHQITEVVANGDISQNTQIENQDILLEINGVNLLQLNYSELSILLGALPVNVQIVYWKKENEYEMLDLSRDDRNVPLKHKKKEWIFPVDIVIHGSRKEPVGLEFIDNTPSQRIISKCVIKRINPSGYFFKDRRISVNDSILSVNDINVYDYDEKEMFKLLLSTKKSVFLIKIGKYKTNTFGSSSDFRKTVKGKLSLQDCPDMTDSGPRRISHTPNPISSPVCHYLFDEENMGNRGLQLSINLDKSDDLGMYLVDIKDAQVKKSVICGFREGSTLRTKFQKWDEIVEINEENVEGLSSLAIGKTLKEYHYKYDKVTVTVNRGKDYNTTMIPHESNTSREVTPDPSSTPSPIARSKNPESIQRVFHVTLDKINNSFGMSIQTINGPTISHVTTDSGIYQKDTLIPGDKVVRINDIYVLDKDHNFVMTLIRSCGKTINLEILRIVEKDSHFEYMKNPIYRSDSDLEIIRSEKNQKSNGSQSAKSSPKILKKRDNLDKPDFETV